MLDARRPLGGKLTWRSNKALRRSNAETHASVQNLRQEIRQSVRHSRQATEAHGETPNLEIKTRLQELNQVERLGSDICSVGVDTSDDEIDFTLIEEVPRFLRVAVWERYEEAVAHDADADGQDAFDDEDPPAIMLVRMPLFA